MRPRFPAIALLALLPVGCGQRPATGAQVPALRARVAALEAECETLRAELQRLQARRGRDGHALGGARRRGDRRDPVHRLPRLHLHRKVIVTEPDRPIAKARVKFTAGGRTVSLGDSAATRLD